MAPLPSLEVSEAALKEKTPGEKKDKKKKKIGEKNRSNDGETEMDAAAALRRRLSTAGEAAEGEKKEMQTDAQEAGEKEEANDPSVSWRKQEYDKKKYQLKSKELKPIVTLMLKMISNLAQRTRTIESIVMICAVMPKEAKAVESIREETKKYAKAVEAAGKG